MKKTKINIATKIAFTSLVVGGSLVSTIAKADDSSVVLYGVLDATVENVTASGGQYPFKNTFRMNSNNDSFIGLKGSENLGGGTSAVFQLEANVNINGDRNQGYINGNNGNDFWGSRNSKVGIHNEQYGEIFLGTWDTPYKQASLKADPFHDIGNASLDSIIDHSPKMTGGAMLQNADSFDQRAKNSMNYVSPELYGAQFKFTYGLREGHINDATGNGAYDTPSDILSTSIGYNHGPLNASFAYEKHNTNDANVALFGLSGVTDQAFKLAVAYTLDSSYGATTLSAIGERINNKYTILGDDNSFNRNAFGLGVAHKMGPHQFDVGFAKAYGGNDTGAYQLSLGYDYSLSKRTSVYAYATKVKNQENGNYTLNADSPYGYSLGTEYKAVGVGLRHAF